MRLLNWLYHWFTWRVRGEDYRKHQCEGKMELAVDVYTCCTRCKDHCGKHDWAW